MGEDVTFEILHRIADAFARHDVDGIVNSFAEDGEFRNARGPHPYGESYRGKAAIRRARMSRIRGVGSRRREAGRRRCPIRCAVSTRHAGDMPIIISTASSAIE